MHDALHNYLAVLSFFLIINFFLNSLTDYFTVLPCPKYLWAQKSIHLIEGTFSLQLFIIFNYVRLINGMNVFQNFEIFRNDLLSNFVSNMRKRYAIQNKN
jgi:hypothetical protein